MLNFNWLKENKDSTFLNINVVPGSSKTEIVGPYGDFLKIKLKAPPQKGKANKELVEFLAKKLNTAKSNIKIIKGENQRKKVVQVKATSLRGLNARGNLNAFVL